MKKILLLAAAMLMLCLCAFADTPDAAYPDTLYTIVLRTETEDIPLGTGVLYSARDVLLTAASCAQDGELYAINASGEVRIIAKQLVSDSGAALLRLETPAAVRPMEVTAYDQYARAEVIGLDADGKMTAVALNNILFSQYRGRDALSLVTAQSNLKPGTILLDNTNRLLGLTVSRSGEGTSVYTALEANTIYALTWESVAAANKTFLPVSGTYEDGYLRLTWQDDVERRQGVYYLYVAAVDNQYYSYYTAKCDERSIDMILPPGHAYDVQVQWTLNEETAKDIDMMYMKRIRAESALYTEHEMKTESYIAIDPVNRLIPGVHEKDDFFSVDVLADSSRTSGYQVMMSFRVEEKFSVPMVIELIAPDGQFYYEENHYIFSPEHQEDAFCMDLTQLWMDCANFSGNTLYPGHYTLRCHLGGKTVSEYSFQVEPAGTPEPEAPEAKVGFVTNMQLTYGEGTATIDWSESTDLPEGDYTLHLFRMHEGNMHYSLRTLDEQEKDAKSTEFFTLPGRATEAWLVWTKEDGDPNAMYPSFPEEYVIARPDAEIQPYELNGFTTVRSGLTKAEDSDGVYHETEPMTRVWLASGDTISFVVEDRYQVTEASEKHPMLIVLYTPEGFAFAQNSWFGFMPELCEGDIWTQDITRIFRDYKTLMEREVYPAGEYAVVRYIDGCEANRLTFTLEEE